MRAALTYLVALACALGVARANSRGPIHHAAPNQDVQDLLSGVDFVPAKGVLDDALTDPRTDLNDIATDTSLDSGLRIRAIRALGLYPGGETQATLQGLINGLTPATEGTEVIMLRAAMYSFAEVDASQALATIGALLDHPSRDVRTDAAHALAKTGQVGAIPLLRARREDEETGQVLWALTEAIRTLSEM